MVQFSERRTTFPAHRTPSPSGSVATISPAGDASDEPGDVVEPYGAVALVDRPQTLHRRRGQSPSISSRKRTFTSTQGRLRVCLCQPTTVSHDGEHADRSRARMPRRAPTGLRHAAGAVDQSKPRRPTRNDSA